MSMLKKLKNWLYGKGKKGGERPMPSEFQAVRFTDQAKRNALHGDRQKVIATVEDGEERTYKRPYQKEIVESFRDVLSRPVFPETGNKDKPGNDVLDQYDPGNIGWDD